jgi:hypothetical protein
VSVTTQKRSAMPAADMQWRARKIALQASRLADQARPMTKKATMTAQRGAGITATWAKPRVGRVRAWMAVRAARGSISVQEHVAPRVSSVLASAARRLDPPVPQTKRWPKVLAGTALLAAGAAAATAMALRSKSKAMPGNGSKRPQAKGATSDQRSGTVNPNADKQRAMSEPGVNGLSRSH